jgi:methyl-accepting chemotaxis protein
MPETPQGARRALVASYGLIIAAVAFALAVVVVMYRFHGILDESLDLVEVQYRESLQYQTLARHVQSYAEESAEAIARSGEAGARAEHARAARKVLGELRTKAEAVVRAEGDDETQEEAAAAAALAEAFEVFVLRLDELIRLDRGAPDFQARFAAAFDELLRGQLLAAIDQALAGEREDVERTVAEYRAVADRWSWGISILIVLLIGVIVTPLYLRLDKGVRRLAEGARRVAGGDYTTRVAVRGMFSSISDAFNGMAQRIQEHRLAQVKMAKELQASSAELLAVAKQTETNAADEAAAVEETRRTMTALLGAAAQIAEGAGTVASSAEQSALASEGIGEQIVRLSLQSQKIRTITATIQGIADKSDVLALNAALEGAKAGDTGRGFVLLGGEMRRLAESVNSAANEVGELASRIEELSRGAVLSTEVGQKLAAATLEVAQRITLITSQQRGATEQVSRSMEEVHQYTQHSLSAAKQTRATASDLVRASAELEELVSLRPGAEAARAAA